MRKNCGMHGSPLHQFAVGCSSAAALLLRAASTSRLPPPALHHGCAAGCIAYSETLSQASRPDAQGKPTPPAIIAAGSALSWTHCCAALRAFKSWSEANIFSYCADEQGCNVFATSQTLPPFAPPPVPAAKASVGRGAAASGQRCAATSPHASCVGCRCPAGNNVVGTCPSARHVKGAFPPQLLPPRLLAPKPALQPGSALSLGPPCMQVPVGTCLLMYGDLAGRSDMRLSANPSYNTGIWVEKRRWL